MQLATDFFPIQDLQREYVFEAIFPVLRGSLIYDKIDFMLKKETEKFKAFEKLIKQTQKASIFAKTEKHVENAKQLEKVVSKSL